ncbi:MAG: hypothetical protein MK073_02075 [Phycisphaerales bacterium]|nr:hypothetical protein [Phycisphaerales bacterium]
MFLHCIAHILCSLSSLQSSANDNEAKFFGPPVMLTSPSMFVKAGESYFDPQTKRIIFQAIEHPKDGETVSDDYSMYVADLTFDAKGAISGISNIVKISHDGSANTCGWFHPSKQNTVLFATTTTKRTDEQVPGYQRDSGDYRWAFPPEMNIVECELTNPKAQKPLIVDNEHYIAEGSWSPDGRHVLFCSLEGGDGDIYVRDLERNITTHLVHAPGYDGGPFFSPDGKRITYRSDRAKNDLLQLYVSELKFDEHGTIVGVQKEHQVTSNQHVNWGPFWHPTGKALLYATSEMGHYNYEVYMVDVTNLSSLKEGEDAPHQRVTHTPSFDGLPVFNADGTWLMWTSKRGTDTSQLWVAPFTFNNWDWAKKDASQ